METQRVETAFEAHQQPDHPAGDLCDDRDPFVVRLVEQREHVLPEVGCIVGLVQVDADRAARTAGEFFHPRPLVDREVGVVGANWKTPWPARARA